MAGSGLWKILKDSKNYFLGDIAIKGISFLAIPVLTRLLSPADYGIISVFNSYVGVLVVILPLYAYSAIGRYYYEGKNDFGEFFGSSLAIVLALILPLFGGILYYRNYFQSLLNFPVKLIPLLLGAVFLEILTSIYMQITVPRKRSGEYSIVNVLKVILGLGLSIYIIRQMSSERYAGRIYGQLIAGGIASSFYLYRIAQLIKIKVNWSHVKYIISYSIPLMFFPLGRFVLGYFDRIMINKMLDSSSAGLYSAGYNVALLISVISFALLAALDPYWMEYRKQNNFVKIDFLVKNIFKIIIAFAFLLILFSNEIVLLMMPRSYHSAVGIVPIVVIGYVFWAMFTIYMRSIAYTKKTIFISLATVLGGILNIIMNFIYIPKYGYIASAYTTVVSFFFIFLFAWVAAKYILKQRVTPLATMCRPLFLLLPYLGIYYLLMNLQINIFFAAAIKITVFFSFVIIIFNDY